jgi:hypothetical protein
MNSAALVCYNINRYNQILLNWNWLEIVKFVLLMRFGKRYNIIQWTSNYREKETRRIFKLHYNNCIKILNNLFI